VSARYRAPLIPFLLVFSACGATWLARRAIAGAWGPFAAGLVACGLVFAGSRTYPVPREATRANGLYWLAIAEGRSGKSEVAIDLLRESIALFPASCAAQTALGVHLHALGRSEEGVAALERAIAECPRDVVALDALAEIFLAAQRFPEAEALARRSIAAAPHLRRGYYELGRAAIGQVRLVEAADAFRSALERGPDSFNSAYALARVSLALGRDEGAIHALRRAVASPERVDPRLRREAYGALIEALRRTGRDAEARRFAQEARAREAGD
jgi:tetratricopeptide (TPR) repeat protein